MHLFVTFKKSTIIKIILLFLILVLSLALYGTYSQTLAVFDNKEFSGLIEEVFANKNTAILLQDTERVAVLYDTSKKYGQWAYENEIKRMKYIKKWSDKQGVKFTNIKSNIVIRYAKKRSNGFTSNLIVSTEYKYIYESEPEKVNLLRIGTYHILDMVEKDGIWIINKEWYTDPFADSLNLNDIKTEEIKNYIVSQMPKDYSSLMKRRADAVAYADKYCGAASDGSNNYRYNKKYRDYNPLGGDCANFASQILYEGGKFRKTGTWSYDKGGSSKAWVNAQAFKNFMISSGRASLVAYGPYNKVYKASYKLQPGDFVAYEKKGTITHISVVTGADSRGYVLVNCHNTDRYRVPWDLGWSDSGIKFYLVHVHY